VLAQSPIAHPTQQLKERQTRSDSTETMASSGKRYRYSGRPTGSERDPRNAAPETKHPVQLHLWRQCHGSRDVFEEVLAGDPEHSAVACSARLALDFLGGLESRKVLADIGNDAVKKWSPRQHVYDDPPDQMLGWVDFFLRWLEKDFVNVELQTLSPCNGSFLPCDWYNHGDEGMGAWRPSIAGTMRLSHPVCFSPRTHSPTFSHLSPLQTLTGEKPWV
jgi:hypothetical protein